MACMQTFDKGYYICLVKMTPSFWIISYRSEVNGDASSLKARVQSVTIYSDIGLQRISLTTLMIAPIYHPPML